MPTPSTELLADLLALPTKEELVTVEIGILKDGGFPVTNWGPKSLPSMLVNANCAAMLPYGALVPAIAAAPFRTLAKGDWLTLLAQDNFEIERGLAGIAKRKLRLTDGGSGGATYSADSLTVKTDGGLFFILDETAVVPLGGHVDVTFRAQSPGSAYNGSVAVWTLVTSVPGLDVADAPAGVTVPGVDEQSDDDLSTVMGDQWSTLGRGANDDAYDYLAKNVDGLATGLVSRVLVLRRTPLPGQVTLYIAGPTAASPVDGGDALDSTTITTVQNFIDPPGHVGERAPNCVDVFIHTAKYKKIALVGTVYVVASEHAAAQAAAQAALNSFAAKFPIGGGFSGSPVNLDRLIAKIASGLSDDPRNQVELTSPVADVGLLVYEVPYFDFSGLFWQEV